MIEMLTAIILFNDKLERNHRIAKEDNIGIVIPPGILKDLESVL